MMSSKTPQNFDSLISQAQIAHRLLVGFYQRLLPTIQQVTQQLELTFGEWDPVVTDRPCKRSKDPAEHWAWDMVPMMASSHTYWRANGTSAEIGDAVFNLYISFDSNFSHKDWEDFGIAEEEEADATAMPIGEAFVEIYLGRCVQRSDATLKQLWEKAGDVEEDEELMGQWHAISSHMCACYLKKTLAEFIATPENIVQEVRTLLE